MNDKEEVERLIEESREEWHEEDQNTWSLSLKITKTYEIDGDWELVLENGRYVWRKKE